MADHGAAGRIGAGPVAARRVTGLQRAVRLRSGEDVVLVARDLRALHCQRLFAADQIALP
jgi:hypothetical protein